MTGRPAAFSAFALASTARVADSEIAAIRAEIRVLMDTIVAEATGGSQPDIGWARTEPDARVAFGSTQGWFDT
ncbi:hypothetical protein GCM10027176_16520 [Actinoallomurus bryophytorum]